MIPLEAGHTLRHWCWATYSIHRDTCKRRRIANGALPAPREGVDIERGSGEETGASRQRSVVPEEPWRQIRLPDTRPSTWVPCLPSTYIFFSVL